MRYRRKIVLLLVQVVLLVLLLFLLPRHRGLVNIYDRFIFYPFQSIRGFLLGFLPFSIGDVLYVAGGIWVLVTIIRWGRYLLHFSSQKQQLASSLLSAVNTVVFFYLFFVLGWGGNYYKQPVRTHWGFAARQRPKDSIARRQYRTTDSLTLIAFDSFLVNRLNSYAPHYRQLTFGELNKRTKEYYKQHTDCNVAKYGLGIKPTFFGYFMERTAVEGYYNPFTGEGQIDKGQPGFMMPFLFCHECAHQAGIAAEGDANLIAYALCTASGDSAYCYSAYLNIWLYNNNRLYRRDSSSAKKFEAQLNKLTTAHIDTLEQLALKYQNDFARYSSELFDSYLKMQDQKEGIRSYGNVATDAWMLEKRRTTGAERIRIP